MADQPQCVTADLTDGSTLCIPLRLCVSIPVGIVGSASVRKEVESSGHDYAPAITGQGSAFEVIATSTAREFLDSHVLLEPSGLEIGPTPLGCNSTPRSRRVCHGDTWWCHGEDAVRL